MPFGSASNPKSTANEIRDSFGGPIGTQTDRMRSNGPNSPDIIRSPAVILSQNSEEMNPRGSNGS